MERKLVNELLRTSERIQRHLKALEKQYLKKFSEKKFDYYIRRDYQWCYYSGKLYAYSYVVKKLGTKKDHKRFQKIFTERGAVNLKEAKVFEFLPHLSPQRKKAWTLYLARSKRN